MPPNPNVDGPPGTLSEESQSSDHQTQLEQIESTLSRLQQKTLKMKKRNDKIIGSFDRRSTQNQYQDQGSSQNVNAVIPIKPPRRVKPILFPDVEKVLKESDEIKKKLHDTLRLCSESREKSIKYLEEVRKESQDSLRFASSLQNNLNMTLETTIQKGSISSASSLVKGIRDSVKGVFQKLSFPDSKSQEPYKVGNVIQVYPTNGDSNLISAKVETMKPEAFKSLQPDLHSTPKPKPRIRSSLITKSQEDDKIFRDKSRIVLAAEIKRPLGPPPVPPRAKTNVTYEELKKMYTNVTEDTSLPRPPGAPPIPKPRTKLPLVVPTTTQEQTASECDESSSEFEYVMNPLVVSTIAISEADSDESLITDHCANKDELDCLKVTNSQAAFTKNHKLSNKGVPRPYRKPKLEQLQVEDLKSTAIKEAPRKSLSKQRPRPSSPPPKILVRVPSLQSVLTSLAEEELITSPSNQMLNIPAEHRINTHPPPLLLSSKSLDSSDIPVSYELKTLQSRPSALRSDVPVCPITVPVKPYGIQDSPSRYKSLHIYTSPFTVDSGDKNPLLENKVNGHEIVYSNPSNELITIPNMLNKDEDISIQNTIHENFAFLDTTNEDETDDEIIPPVNDFNSPELKEARIEKSCLYSIHNALMIQTEVNTGNDSTLYPLLPVSEESQIFNKIEDLKIDYPPPLPKTSPPLQQFHNTDKTSPPSLLPKNASPIQQVAQAPPPPAMPNQPIYSDSFTMNKRRFANLPITPLDDISCRRTIFDVMRPVNTEMFQIDLQFIEKNFCLRSPETETRKISNNGKVSSESVDSPTNQSAVSLLSQNRQTAIEIGAKKLETPTDEIPAALKGLNKLTSDDIQILLQILPKDNEKSMFESLEDKKNENLCKVDQLMKTLIEIPRVSSKLEAINFMLNFDETIQTLQSEIVIIENATRSVKASEKFPKMLEVVLLVINKAFVKDAEPVRGFQIQSLHRLASKKSADGKVSLLNYIIKCLKNSSPEAVHFYEDFTNVDEASKVSKDDFEKFLKETQSGVEQIHKEVALIQSETKDLPDSLSQAFQFVEKATITLTKIKKQWETALEELKKVMEYFGVSKNSIDPIDFLKIIRTFVNDYKKFVAENEKLFQSEVTEPNRNMDRQNKQQSPSSNSLQTVKMRTRLNPRDSSILDGLPKVSNRRQSLGNIESTIREIEENSGQPSDFIDAMLVMGNMQNQEKTRRRNSLYVPRNRSPKKSTTIVENRER